MAGGKGLDFHILALTGGGYRGLYTAHVLERLEAAAGKPIGRCFDLIAGTSIGGILALAIAFEVPMAQVVTTFRSDGELIFPKRCALSGLFRNRHAAEPLSKVIVKLLPRGAKLSAAKHAVVIPALNLTKGKQQVLKTRHFPDWNRDPNYLVNEIALATAAAPIYFPIAQLDNQLFLDGGMFANAPDLVALHEANKFLHQKDERICMLSVGTLTSRYAMPASTKRNRGVSSWLRPPGFPLVQTILAAQEQFAMQIVAHRLQDRYVRIDSELSDLVMADLGLDKADSIAQQSLLGIAAKDISDKLDTAEIQRFIKHSPKQWLIKDKE